MYAMVKLLVVCCMLVLAGAAVLADPAGLQDRQGQSLFPFGCRDRQAGRQACAGASPPASLVPHPRDCHLFFYCTHAGPVCRRCPFRLHFNPRLRVCDWPNRAGCTANNSRPSTPEPPSNSTSEPQSNSSSKPPLKPSPKPPSNPSPKPPSGASSEPPSSVSSEPALNTTEPSAEPTSEPSV